MVESGGLLIEADVVEQLGAHAYVYGRTRFGDSEQQIIAHVHGRNSPTKGDILHVRPRRDHVHLFRVSGAIRQLTAAVTRGRALRRRGSVCG